MLARRTSLPGDIEMKSHLPWIRQHRDRHCARSLPRGIGASGYTSYNTRPFSRRALLQDSPQRYRLGYSSCLHERFCLFPRNVSRQNCVYGRVRVSAVRREIHSKSYAYFISLFHPAFLFKGEYTSLLKYKWRDRFVSIIFEYHAMLRDSI